jgi:hypothetical protein
MRLYAADPRAYDKIARTQQRAAEIGQRVRAHLEAQAAAEARRPEVQQAEQVENAPARPRRNLRSLAAAIVEAQPAATESDPEPAVEVLDEPTKRRRSRKKV